MDGLAKTKPAVAQRNLLSQGPNCQKPNGFGNLCSPATTCKTAGTVTVSRTLYLQRSSGLVHSFSDLYTPQLSSGRSLGRVYVTEAETRATLEVHSSSLQPQCHTIKQRWNNNCACLEWLCQKCFDFARARASKFGDYCDLPFRIQSRWDDSAVASSTLHCTRLHYTALHYTTVLLLLRL